MPQGISLCGRPERSYHPKVRHFAVVDAILYPPKVSSERVVDDVGTDGNNRRNGSKVSFLWLTCLNTCKITKNPAYSGTFCEISYGLILLFSLNRLLFQFIASL